MIHSPGLLFTILAFALVIGPLVFLHELGHYLAGRLFGVKAEVFSIGFGKEVFGVTDKRGTRWKFSALPLGGYVRFAGDMNAASQPDAEWLMLPPEQRAQTFPSKPVWQRAIIVAAGPVMNFLVAIVILSGFALVVGDPGASSVAGQITAGSAAAVAGIEEGDHITAFDGQPVATFADMVSYVAPRPNTRTRVTFEHEGVPRTVQVTIGTRQLADRSGKAIAVGLLGINRPRISIIDAPGVGVRRTSQIVGMMAQGIGQIIVGQRSVRELGGPLTIARVSGEQMALGADAFVWLIALVSINLGFINLLPVPMLDGGHLFFYAIEAVRRKPVEPQVQEWAFRGGLAALLALMLLVTFNDLGSFGLWNNLAGLIG
ncbi:RIP metalloprotease RseP [Sphingomonas oligophenolica]|uniref:M50 family metallopeptidase n=1 Tax=Sphingomonas oligophenolica TaxID=301154 RepID=A0ABU9XXZ9_9SPHN